MAQLVTSLPAMQETWVRSLGWEDPLEKVMATPSSVLVWRITWTEEPGGLQSMGSQRVVHDRATFTFHPDQPAAVNMEVRPSISKKPMTF